jgi:hypothetical protein
MTEDLSIYLQQEILNDFMNKTLDRYALQALNSSFSTNYYGKSILK